MTFKEIVQILRPQGKFFISDPIPNEEDSERFVDEYMQMKKDGHIRFYLIHPNKYFIMRY